jgi:hypothetical protein
MEIYNSFNLESVTVKLKEHINDPLYRSAIVNALGSIEEMGPRIDYPQSQAHIISDLRESLENLKYAEKTTSIKFWDISADELPKIKPKGDLINSCNFIVQKDFRTSLADFIDKCLKIRNL